MSTLFAARNPGRVWGARIALMLVAGACLATSRPMLRRNYPMWTLQHLGTRQLSCARFNSYIKKSGKAGVGLVLSFEPVGEGCEVEVQAASLDVGGEQVQAGALPPAQRLRAAHYVYVAFPFDNEAAWNEGRTTGTLRLTLRVGTRVEALVLPMKHRWEATHVFDRSEPHAPASSSPQGAPASDAPLLVHPAAAHEGDFAEPPP